MTADGRISPYEFLAKVSNDIINKVEGVNRVPMTSRQNHPATRDWDNKTTEIINLKKQHRQNKQDMIVISGFGKSPENTVLARAIRALGVYSEITRTDITAAELKALPNVKGYHHQRWPQQCG